MAKAIATITGTALAPGVSRNGRLYTREAIGKMVARAAERIVAGQRPITMYTSHDSMDVADIGGVLTRIWQESDGRARYDADVPDTPTGHAVAALADTAEGPQFLQGVSILGNWVGGQRKETVSGRLVETGDDFELGRLDFTTSPGVDGAGIDDLRAAAAGGEAHGFAISESAPEALVTAITEETGTQPVAESAAEGASEAMPPVPDEIREAVRAVFAPAEAHVLEDGLCATCGDVEEAKRTRNTKPYGDVPYADPGYLDADGNQASKSGKPGIKRYPLDKKHIRPAWTYINQAKNAAQYTAGQLKRIKGRIKSAMRSIGAKVAAESDIVGGFVIGEAVEATGPVLEWLGDDPKRSGSWSVSACNGPVSMNMSSYCMDPADLDVIIRAAADAVCTALKKLDPDMDGDVDVPGADSGDTDSDSGSTGASALASGTDAFGGESAPQPPATEDEPASEAGETGPAPAGTDEKEDSVMTETSTTDSGAGAQSGLTLESVQKTAAEAAAAAVTAAFEARDAAKEKAKAERKEAAAKEAREAAARKAALTEALAELGIKVPGQATGTAHAQEGAPAEGSTTESEEERVQRLVKEGVTGAIQELVSVGAVIPGRAGLQVREHAVTPEEMPEELHKLSDEDFKNLAGGALDKYVGDSSNRIDAVHS